MCREQRRIALLVHTTTHTRLRHYYHCQHHHHHQHHDGGGWLLMFMHILFNFIIIILCHSERTFCVRRRCGDVLWRHATALHSHITTAYNDIIYIIMTVMCRDKSFDNSILPFIMYLFYHQPTCCRCICANGEIAGKLIDEKLKQNLLRDIEVLAVCWWLQKAECRVNIECHLRDFRQIESEMFYYSYIRMLPLDNWVFVRTSFPVSNSVGSSGSHRSAFTFNRGNSKDIKVNTNLVRLLCCNLHSAKCSESVLFNVKQLVEIIRLNRRCVLSQH